MLIESGGDNLAATFSPELADLTVYVIDVAAGDKIPSKGGPGITRSDLLVINKIDLAPHVGASLEVMERDAKRMRGARPFVFSNLRTGQGLDAIVRFIEAEGWIGDDVGWAIEGVTPVFDGLRARRCTVCVACANGGPALCPTLRKRDLDVQKRVHLGALARIEHGG